ncbi:MAG TPA: pyridoxal phosphate-dependent aminotransferase [Ktedonobacteraceae bacterium]|nr:pyridoxal phosphate-dependent aminotransferase [Ktedonobacteraceae bacterium]
MIIHNTATDELNTSGSTREEQHKTLRRLRSEILARNRPLLQKGPGPIRVMARLVAELEQECRRCNIDEEIMAAEIVNRTIGDVNLRQVTECEGEPGGPGDYRRLADDLGIALPGEDLHGYTATGETYLWLREQMMECERLLLKHGYDPRIYDIYGVGNPVLRSWLAEEMWGLPVKGEQVYLSLGAMDGIDKVLRGLAHVYREQNITDAAVLFPEPGFGVPEWQAKSSGYRLHRFPTLPEHHFKLTASQLDQILAENTDIRIIYLTITNNPTAFAYHATELDALHAVLRRYWQQGRDILTIADLAYIGTGNPQHDTQRMEAFLPSDVLTHTIFISSFSKTHSLTGERLGWITCGDPAVAQAISPSWSNTMASLPGEWQLRFMAYLQLIRSRPWIAEKMRAFYRLRRSRLIAQLRRIDEEQHLFAEIYIDDDATVYNWSRLRPEEDAFSFFEKTGIASVPGSGFGYSDEFIRFSIGVIPVSDV